METEAACQLFKEAPKNKVKFSSYPLSLDNFKKYKKKHTPNNNAIL